MAPLKKLVLKNSSLMLLLLITLNAAALIASVQGAKEPQEDDSEDIDVVEVPRATRTRKAQGFVHQSPPRPKRQDEGGLDDESKALVCDFGSGPALEFCNWAVPTEAHANVRWRTGRGSLAYWLGGPLVDKTADDASGGYVYFETSYKAVNRVFSSAALESGSGSDIRIQVINESGNYYNYTSGGQSSSTGSLNSPSASSSSSSSSSSFSSSPSSPSSSSSSSSSFLPHKQSLSVSNLDEPLLVIPSRAHLLSPNITQTGPQGLCINFFYNLDGLSAEKLRILVKDIESDNNQTLWESATESEGKWVRASIAYAYETTHQLILEGVAKSVDEPERAYRGYVAVDDMQFAPMGDGNEDACHGHCTFEGGTCGWTNQEENDDFDWILARGSDNFFTGPARDYYSFSKEYPLGGFIYIEAGYPRRPGDKALLVSPTFEATGENQAICFKFATHMYGNGVGSLRVWLRPQDAGDENPEKVLWEMAGEAGNNWYLAQLPIASAVSFQIVFEGVVGSNYLGNIAIDSISIEQGSCPISPQTASRKSGDCTFEENMCFWTNPLVDSHLDDFDWIRQFSYGNFGPKSDNTKKSTLGYFMSLNGDHLQPKRGGTYAWLISGEFSPQGSTTKCMSFYYYMYQRVIDPGGPSLGGLRVYIRTTDHSDANNVILLPVWRLNNHQSMKWRKARVALIGNHQVASGGGGEGATAGRKPPANPYQVVIEGIWGDARVGSIALDDISFVDGDCTTTPLNAVAVAGECSFDRSLCGWRNLTKKSISREGQLSASLGNKVSSASSSHSSALTPRLQSGQSQHPLGHRLNNGESITWRLASPNSRPANLQDHTFRAPIGYIFFDVFNQNQVQNPILRSRRFPGKEGEVTQKCLSFWFSPFGRSESTQLSIYQTNLGDADGEAGGGGGDAPAKDAGGGDGGDGSGRILLWSIQTRKFDTRRPQWYYGQVTVNAEAPHQISLEGEAIDGGFAIDDITFYEGNCQTRPKEATVAAPKSDGE